jgi:hypothetical protein
MSTFPNFSNIKSGIQSRLNSRKGDSKKVSGLNAWVRLTSGTGDGLTLYSNPDVALFGAAGIYGDAQTSGTYGFSWGLGAQAGGSDGPLRPSPIVSNMEIDEGAGPVVSDERRHALVIELEDLRCVGEVTLQHPQAFLTDGVDLGQFRGMVLGGIVRFRRLLDLLGLVAVGPLGVVRRRCRRSSIS